MSLEELARRLYKPRWADQREYAAALRAVAKLTPEQLDRLAVLACRHSSLEKIYGR